MSISNVTTFNRHTSLNLQRNQPHFSTKSSSRNGSVDGCEDHTAVAKDKASCEDNSVISSLQKYFIVLLMNAVPFWETENCDRILASERCILFFLGQKALIPVSLYVVFAFGYYKRRGRRLLVFLFGGGEEGGGGVETGRNAFRNVGFIHGFFFFEMYTYINNLNMRWK